MPEKFRTANDASAHIPGRGAISRAHPALFRRPTLFLRRLGRMAERLHAEEKDYFLRPPAIVNSFPHSGARLLLQLAHAIPETRYYGGTLSSLPTIPFRERSDLAHDRMIRRIIPGEIVGAHLFFNDSHARRIAARNGVHFLLLRDLRDVAVAEAHELTYVKFWHRLHPFFASLKDDAARISAAIRGFAHARFPYRYPNIAHRFARYSGWLNRYDVMCVSCEDLYLERFEAVIREMVHFYSRQRRKPVDEDIVVREARRIIAIERPGTPRATAPGAWTRVFTEEHHRQFEEIAGDLNRRLGYAGASDRLYTHERPETGGPRRRGEGVDRSDVVPFPTRPRTVRVQPAAGKASLRDPRTPPRGR